MTSYVIIGMGLFGSRLAVKLTEAGHQVLAIDKDQDRIEEIADRVSRAVCFDAKDREAMLTVGVDRYDTAIVATTNDLASSVLMIMNLKSFDMKKIICKAKNETEKTMLQTLGNVEVIIPEDVAAERLCRRVTHPNVLEYTRLSDEYEMVETGVPESFVGKTIAELNIRVKMGLNVIAIRRQDKLIPTFDPYEPLLAGDTLTVIGDIRHVKKFLGKDQ